MPRMTYCEDCGDIVLNGAHKCTYPLYQVQLETKNKNYCFEIAALYGDHLKIARKNLKNRGEPEWETAHLGGYSQIGRLTEPVCKLTIVLF